MVPGCLFNRSKSRGMCDAHERPICPLTVENGEIRFDARPYGLFTIRAQFDEGSVGK